MSEKAAPVAGQATAALKQANRSLFEAATPSFGAAREHVLQLQQKLAETIAQRDDWEAQVNALHASTTWRMTRPVRWAIEKLRPRREAPAVGVEPVVPTSRPIPTYDDWIARSEADVIAGLLALPLGGRPMAPSRIGLVCIGQDGPPASSGEGVSILSLPGGMSPAEIVATSLARLDVDLICFLDSGVTLAKDALDLVAVTAARDPELDIIFGDEDWLDEAGNRIRPFFKPGWNPEMQRAGDLLGPCSFLRASMVAGVPLSTGPAWQYDLASQVAAMTGPERIGHIPAVLCHGRTLPPGYADALREAVSAGLQRDGVQARVGNGNGAFHRIVYAMPEPAPLVSVIIPTRDHPELLGVCAEGLLHRTNYPRLELLIVDNGTTEPEALELLDRLAADSRVRVLRDPAPFNWSALNNRAAAQATGDVLLLLNNDIAVLEPEWLNELVSRTMQPGVGAVGAKLLYPDGRVQHAGVATDERGIPRHVSRFAPGDDPGPFGMLAYARDIWGVTGACLAVRRDVFFQAGGLNDSYAFSFNDIDFCLRLTVAGYRIVWTPWAVLEHRELATRPPDHSLQRRLGAENEIRRMQRDWGALVQYDPYLHRSLELIDEHPQFRVPPPDQPT